MRKPATAAIALILFALPIAGCGSDAVDKNAYVKSVSAVQAKAAADSSTFTKAMAADKDQKAMADTLDQFGKAIESDADDLSKVKTPKEVTAEHAAYVKLMRQFGADLESLAPQLQKATSSTIGAVSLKATDLTKTLAANEAKIVGSINSKLQG